MRVRYCREKVLRDLGAFCAEILATLLVWLGLLGYCCQHWKVAFEARYESLASAGTEGVLALMVFSSAVGGTNR